MSKINWGEEDVRDVMDNFDQSPTDREGRGLRGERVIPGVGRVIVHVYWSPRSHHCASVYDLRENGKWKNHVVGDPIEAVCMAMDLTRRLASYALEGKQDA